MRPTPDPDVDLDVVAAESRLDSLDQAPSTPDDGPDLLVRHAAGGDDGMHVEDPDADLDAEFDDLDDEGPGVHEPDPADAVLAFIDYFNARDLDGLLEVVAPDAEAPGLGNDAAGFVDAVDILWERSPTGVLTIGRLDDRDVAVLWEVAEGRWWKRAVLLFDGVEAQQVGLVEMVEDPETFDATIASEPDAEVDEGLRWEEWEEGDTG